MTEAGRASSGAIRLGVSACLLGERVRYDGGHKLERFLAEVLGKSVQYVPVCPEVECGLGVPREPMRLEGDPARPRLVTLYTGKDHTEMMLEWAERRVVELEAENLRGFVFKSGSPSSGMERVKVHGENGIVLERGAGLFAAAFMAHFPFLPVQDEERLRDPRIRRAFLDAIFTF